MAQSRLQNRNVVAGSKRTSMRLEPEIWAAMADVCRREGVSEREIIRRAQSAYDATKLTSAVRIYMLEYFRTALAEHARGLPVTGLAGTGNHAVAPS